MNTMQVSEVLSCLKMSDYPHNTKVIINKQTDDSLESSSFLRTPMHAYPTPTHAMTFVGIKTPKSA
jgi:hypothetical protein